MRGAQTTVGDWGEEIFNAERQSGREAEILLGVDESEGWTSC